MRVLPLLVLPLLMVIACEPANPPRAVDAASVVLLDVPIPQGAVPTTLGEYSVPGRTVDDVMAFYVQRLPEYGWVFDKRGSTLKENPNIGAGLRVVSGCRTDGAFVSANLEQTGTAVRVLLVKSRDQDTLNIAAAIKGQARMNSIGPCPS